ncbi:serine carboxypeptidase 1-like isoform X2 [Tripterygium wilfordii]|nr:serine carboxypeptidase 1-like isoform X2 [Tripterygium wilfordii]XP_038703783.1 serine carboxypeptidase 1-like isoform X2 [Tripterygium wilfordii]
MGMEKLSLFWGSLLCIVFSFAFAKAAVERQVIESLPGFSGTFPSKHYSGYITVDQKHLFYYFVVSERKPLEDPVVLWLNGGPGCSSFDGFVYEHGPFKFEAGKGVSQPTLHLNPYSWSKVSNIIYLDSPAGVGFSYSENTTKYNTTDLQTAADSHAFLLKWFEVFPEFVKNPFFLSGESYAGVYVPTLAAAVVQGIKDGAKPHINFKGYMVGNGMTDNYYDANSFVSFSHGMALISDQMFEEVQAACKGKYYNPTTPRCAAILQKIDKVVKVLNIYDILEPCYNKPGSANAHEEGKTALVSSFQQLAVTTMPLRVRKQMIGRTLPLRTVKSMKDGVFTTVSAPCTDDVVATAWLNNAAVRNAIHAAPASVAGAWVLCTDRISYHSDTGSMIPYHKNLTTQGYRALIFTGDHDLRIPFTGTQGWTRSIGYNVVDEWRPWFVNNQAAGYLQGYANNLIFLTIKGAGHTVPEYKPQEALYFYSQWLDGKQI